MRRLLLVAIFILVVFTVAEVCQAGLYRVYLIREGDNLYKDMNSNIYFKTILCLNLGLEDAIFDDSRMELYFPQSRESCTVERLLR